MNNNYPVKTGKDFPPVYGNQNDNQPNRNYLIYEVWESGHPDIGVAYECLEFKDSILSNIGIDKLISLTAKLSTKLKDPILTIQADIGKGSVIRYYYKDKREGIPPNAVGHTIKPIYDNNIQTLRVTTEQGKSLVYQSPLSSPSLGLELVKLNWLIQEFFADRNIDKYVNKSNSMFANELFVNNKSLL